MDAALPHISKLQLKNSSDLSIVKHSEEAANLCLDKRLTQEFCEKFKIKIPKSYSPGQVYDKNLIIKPAKGFGGKGIIDCGVDAFDTVPDYGGDFVYQEKIIGQETTHDIYIDSKFNVVASSRDNLLKLFPARWFSIFQYSLDLILPSLYSLTIQPSLI
jgi:predicted ATP-grasp superfamily ATP-dependent carboligase